MPTGARSRYRAPTPTSVTARTARSSLQPHDALAFLDLVEGQQVDCGIGHHVPIVGRRSIRRRPTIVRLAPTRGVPWRRALRDRPLHPRPARPRQSRARRGGARGRAGACRCSSSTTRLLAGRCAGRALRWRSALADLDRSLRRLGGALVVRRGEPVEETLRGRARDGSRGRLSRRRCLAPTRGTASGGLRERARAARFAGRDGRARRARWRPPDRDCYVVFTPYHRAWAGAGWRRARAAAQAHAAPRRPRRRRARRGRRRGGETAARAQLTRWLAGGDRRLRASARRPRPPTRPRGSRSRSTSAALAARGRDARRAATSFVRQLAGATSTPSSSPRTPRARAATCTRAAARWRDDPDGLAAWKEGMTGYPLVDAGMRELARRRASCTTARAWSPRRS